MSMTEKTLSIPASEELHDRFWKMKNEQHPILGESLNHDEALEYLMDLYDESDEEQNEH